MGEGDNNVGVCSGGGGLVVFGGEDSGGGWLTWGFDPVSGFIKKGNGLWWAKGKRVVGLCLVLDLNG